MSLIINGADPVLVNGYVIFSTSPALALGNFNTFLSNLNLGAAVWPLLTLAIKKRSDMNRILITGKKKKQQAASLNKYNNLRIVRFIIDFSPAE